LADARSQIPALRKYRNGLLRNAHRWNFDHGWFLVVGLFHTGRGGPCLAARSSVSSATQGIDHVFTPCSKTSPTGRQRELRHQIYGILDSGQPYNPEKRGFAGS
jgi:hypothetical protein